MSYLEQAAILVALVVRLRDKGGWAGATHLQKAAYLLQEMLRVPLGFRFPLYKYGPYSSGLRDTTDAMEADGFIEIEPQSPPYGARLSPGPSAATLEQHVRGPVEQFEPQLEFVADQLGTCGVGELERLATAFFVTAQGGGGVDFRAAKLNEIKPHVSLEDAVEAVRRIDGMTAAAPAVS